ncbi:DUF2391 family protein [Candidatus Woesearchaeota archaeon]|nr:DUF2391 family protein [Candidatus Woesearchaeota archaeon]
MKPKKKELAGVHLHAIRVEFHFKDLLQVIIGASILAIPVGFTEETWRLGETLPWLNVFILGGLSLLFISAFVYDHYYRGKLNEHWFVFIERVVLTYVVSFLVVAVLLTVIQRTPWSLDLVLSLKRVAIVTFPSTLSAAIADVLK